MTALDYILDGLEAELALERELGVRSIEIDRSLLAVVPAGPRVSSGSSSSVSPSETRISSDPGSSSSSSAAGPAVAPPPVRQSNDPTVYPFVFLHDRPLSPAGVEMMAKIVTAMGKTAETAPVVIAPPLPKAKVYVVLGGLALKRWFPGQLGAPNQWIRTEEGQDILVSNSPEYILRFKTVTPAVKKIKLDMWQAIKAVLKRV